MHEEIIRELVERNKALEKRLSDLETREQPLDTTLSNYGGTSTIVGWSSTPSGKIHYKRVGKLVLVDFYLTGTSNSTTTSFTLPDPRYTDASITSRFLFSARDNTGTFTAGIGDLGSASSTVTLFSTVAGAGWTASGTKTVLGQFWYIAA